MISEIPVAGCSLEDEELAVRARRWRTEIRPAVIEERTIEGGMLIRLRREPQTEENLRELIRLEADCCPHLDFDLQRAGSDLRLTVRFAAVS